MQLQRGEFRGASTKRKGWECLNYNIWGVGRGEVCNSTESALIKIRVYKHLVVSKPKILKLLCGKGCWRTKAEQPNYTKMVEEVSTISPDALLPWQTWAGHRRMVQPWWGRLAETHLHWQHKPSWASWGDHPSPQHMAWGCADIWVHSCPSSCQCHRHPSRWWRCMWKHNAAFQKEHPYPSAWGGEGSEGRTLSLPL